MWGGGELRAIFVVERKGHVPKDERVRGGLSGGFECPQNDYVQECPKAESKHVLRGGRYSETEAGMSCALIARLARDQVRERAVRAPLMHR